MTDSHEYTIRRDAVDIERTLVGDKAREALRLIGITPEEMPEGMGTTGLIMIEMTKHEGQPAMRIMYSYVTPIGHEEIRESVI